MGEDRGEKGGTHSQNQCSSNNAAICSLAQGTPLLFHLEIKQRSFAQSYRSSSLFGPLVFHPPTPTNREEKTKRKGKHISFLPFECARQAGTMDIKAQHTPVFIFENSPDAS